MSETSARRDLEAKALASVSDAAAGRTRESVRDELRSYCSRRREPLARLTVVVGSLRASSLISALTTNDLPLESCVLEIQASTPPGPRWDYLVPMTQVAFAPDGSAEITPASSAATSPRQRAIARLIVRERLQPNGGRPVPAQVEGRSPVSGLFTVPEMARALRTSGAVPLSLVLLLYFADRRVRFELDLADDGLQPDIRAGRLPIDRFVPRSPRVSHGVDAFIARVELSVSATRLLEVLVESHGLTAGEAAATFGGIPEMSNSALEALRARRLASFDSPRGVYQARMDAFLGAGAGPPGSLEPLPPMATPALRTSVNELLAAADSRATCPLCGETLPPGPHGILCAKCAAEVGVSKNR